MINVKKMSGSIWHYITALAAPRRPGTDISHPLALAIAAGLVRPAAINPRATVTSIR
jgi:hypothetical protein